MESKKVIVQNLQKKWRIRNVLGTYAFHAKFFVFLFFFMLLIFFRKYFCV